MLTFHIIRIFLYNFSLNLGFCQEVKLKSLLVFSKFSFYIQTYHGAGGVPHCRRHPGDNAEHFRGDGREPEGHRESHLGRVALHGDGECHYGDGLKVRNNSIGLKKSI
jgi:hypothetical protein